MNAIIVGKPGGPEALEYTETDTPRPGPGEALVRIEAVGVNFIDIYHRSGFYPLPTPFVPGSEAAGVVAEVGADVTGLAPGDRVAYVMVPGAYADYAVVPASKLVVLPPAIDSRTAAAAMLQGLTAHYLAASTFPLKAGDTALVHAAAGGVGAILVQMAKQRGARVFGTASETKLDVVRAAGADAAIDYTNEDFEAEIARLTDGEGVDVVYDSVGRTTFEGSLNSLKARGLLVLFGQSSGPVPAIDVLRLMKKSLYLTRPTLGAYLADRQEIEWRTSELFAGILSGAVKIRIDREFSLAAAPEAHRLLEGRATAGKLVLIP